jgi:glyoxylase-like metal-dependent hydrolase (beta-lactamase superfamily II)
MIGLVSDTSFPGGPWTGGPVDDVVECVLAGNPGPMTLDGTNTWLLSAPDARQAVVVDPGPADEEHLAAVLRAAERRGVRVASILLTHGHPDHSDGARRFAELSGAGVRARDPRHRHGGGESLDEGDVVEVDGLRIEVMATPGHTADSLSFLVPAAGALLSGDTVLGRGTAVVAHPDGRLAPYLASLARLRDACDHAGAGLLLPGHGPVLDRPAEVLQGYLDHRRARLDEIRRALAEGARTTDQVVATVYADVDPALWPAARMSVEAQLEYLRAEEN